MLLTKKSKRSKRSHFSLKRNNSKINRHHKNWVYKMSNECQCLTTKGQQCSRTAVKGSRFCWQHQDCKTAISPSKSKTPSLQKSPINKKDKINCDPLDAVITNNINRL